MRLPLDLFVPVLFRPARIDRAAEGELLFVDVRRLAGERWLLTLNLSLPDAPKLPFPTADIKVGINRLASRQPAPLGIESVHWAGYPWRLDVVVAPPAGAGAWATRDDDGFVVTLDVPALLRPGHNAAVFHLVSDVAAPAESAEGFALDYLAKDYSAFRAAMLARMHLLQPGWTDRSPADIGITIVEALAYVADYASQYQDAVAAEAYLATARLRTSLKRHARLLDYRPDDGRNSRLFVHVRVRETCHIAPGTAFIASSHLHGVISGESAERLVLDHHAPVFEAVTHHELDPILNELALFDFDGRGQVLPRGACSALLAVRTGALPFLLAAGASAWNSKGALLGFEPAHNGLVGQVHVVRLISAVDMTDSLPGGANRRDTSIVGVSWSSADALPQEMISGGGSDADHVRCFGNLVLADFGLTVEDELPPVDAGRPYRPVLKRALLVCAVPLSAAPVEPVSVAALLRPDDRTAIPAAHLVEDLDGLGQGAVWTAKNDLLECLPDDRHFTVENPQSDNAVLRFGDGKFGRRPPADRRYRARYRIGDLGKAVVGPHHVTAVLPATAKDAAALARAVVRIENVTRAAGARLPEPNERARMRAAEAWRTPVSCATLAEFSAAARRIPGVAEAVAFLDQQGGRARVLVFIRSGEHVWCPAALIAAVQSDLSARVLAGRRVVVNGPVLIPLDITLAVRLAPGARAAVARAALKRAFCADGDGFFAPASIRFGQTVFASAIAARARAIPLVESAAVTQLARSGGHASNTVPAALLLQPTQLPLVTGFGESADRGRMRFLFEETP